MEIKGEIADILKKTSRNGKLFKIVKLVDHDEGFFVWNLDMISGYDIGDVVKIGFSGSEYLTVESIDKLKEAMVCSS